jgi:hypothetical protein
MAHRLLAVQVLKSPHVVCDVGPEGLVVTDTDKARSGCLQAGDLQAGDIVVFGEPSPGGLASFVGRTCASEVSVWFSRALANLEDAHVTLTLWVRRAKDKDKDSDTDKDKDSDTDISRPSTRKVFMPIAPEQWDHTVDTCDLGVHSLSGADQSGSAAARIGPGAGAGAGAGAGTGAGAGADQTDVGYRNFHNLKRGSDEWNTVEDLFFASMFRGLFEITAVTRVQVCFVFVKVHICSLHFYDEVFYLLNGCLHASRTRLCGGGFLWKRD